MTIAIMPSTLSSSKKHPSKQRLLSASNKTEATI